MTEIHKTELELIHIYHFNDYEHYSRMKHEISQTIKSTYHRVYKGSSSQAPNSYRKIMANIDDYVIIYTKPMRVKDPTYKTKWLPNPDKGEISTDS